MYAILRRGWAFWLCICLVVIFILWLFYGGKDYEYIGLKPLKTGVDSTKYIDPTNYNEIDYDDIGLSSTMSSTESFDSYASDTEDNFNSNVNNVNSVKAIQNNVINVIKNNKNGNNAIFDPNFDNFSEQDHLNSLGKYKHFKGKSSKGEKICKQVIEEICNKPFYTVRPDFLKNPETKRNLEIDCYNDECRLGVEYSGAQHFVYPNGFHKTKEEFNNQIRRDMFKVEQCDRNGIYLITVPYTVPHDKIREYIIERLPPNYAEKFK